MTKRVLSKHLATAALGGLLASATGCGRDDVAHYRVPKEAAAPAPGAPAAPAGMAGSVPPPPDASQTGELSWSLPRGWTESRTGGMRYATLKPPAEGKIDVSVTVFPGEAGGELANVNRWRNQIGLPPLEAAALAKDRKSLRSPAGGLALFDYTSEGQVKTRLVAAILFAGGNSWFVKMVGDAGPVAASRGDFIRLLESLRLADRH
jgi:hypothetical protein